MAGLDPAIHVFDSALREVIDARDERGHDDVTYGCYVTSVIAASET